MHDLAAEDWHPMGFLNSHVLPDGTHQILNPPWRFDDEAGPLTPIEVGKGYRMAWDEDAGLWAISSRPRHPLLSEDWEPWLWLTAHEIPSPDGYVWLGVKTPHEVSGHSFLTFDPALEYRLCQGEDTCIVPTLGAWAVMTRPAERA